MFFLPGSVPIEPFETDQWDKCRSDCFPLRRLTPAETTSACAEVTFRNGPHADVRPPPKLRAFSGVPRRVPHVDALVLIPTGVLVGIANGIAGGGGVISFPVLMALGYSPYVANVTHSVGVVSSSVGSMWAYRDTLRADAKRTLAVCGIATAGSIVGAVLLLAGGPSTFERIVPWLISFGVLLVLVQPLFKKAALEAGQTRARSSILTGASLTLLVGIYGGYFGVAMGIMFLGVFGVTLHEPWQRLNADKNAAAFFVNITGALIFAVFAPVAWGAAASLAVGSLAGGWIGARMAQRFDDALFRYAVAAIGLVAVVVVSRT